MDNVEIFLLSFVCICLVLAAAGGIYLFVNRGKDDEDDDESEVSRSKTTVGSFEKYYQSGCNEDNHEDQTVKYPVTVYRASRALASLGSIKILVDGREIGELPNGGRIKFQINKGSHKISFCFGRKEAKSLMFSVDENNNEASIICYVKSNLWIVPKLEAYVSNVIIEESSVTQNGNNMEKSSGGALGIVVGIILLLVGLYILGVRLRFDFFIIPFAIT